MPLVEKTSREELMLYEVIRHPILCGEFYRNLDIPDYEKPFEYSPYQREYIGDFSHYVSLCCGRAVGKTVTLTDFIVWLLINNVYINDYVVYTVPNKVHLEPVFTNLMRVFRNNNLLKHYVEPKRGINSSSFTITLLNNTVLQCRIAGTSGTGANVVGLHSPIIIVDEAGYYPWGTWLELQPVLNTWQDGYKLFVSGVPTGLRENNVLYLADEADPKFNHHRTGAQENPRYSTDDEERNIIQYGGTDSEDYIHLVLGRHGSPTYAVFDRRLMQIEDYPTYRIKFSGVDIRNYAEMVNRLALLPAVPDNDIVILGIDLGYTDPTAIVIMYEKNNVIREHARINLVKVEYPMQEKLIDYLDTRLGNPPVIGIDQGGPGKTSVQHILQDEAYIHKQYERRIVPIDFGTWIVLGEDPEGNEIKSKTKPYSVSLLQEYSNNHKIVYSTTDLELITEMERMTYTKSVTGEIVYRTLTPRGSQRGEDHNTSAMLCATMAYYMLRDHRLLTRPKRRLLGPRWVIRG
jgi:hypothetical protein